MRRVRLVLHGHANRLLIARVQGIVARHADHPPVDMAAAVAEIHAVTADPHLLGHAWRWPPQYEVFADPRADEKNAILAAAGADPQHVSREMAC